MLGTWRGFRGWGAGLLLTRQAHFSCTSDVGAQMPGAACGAGLWAGVLGAHCSAEAGRGCAGGWLEASKGTPSLSVCLEISSAFLLAGGDGPGQLPWLAVHPLVWGRDVGCLGSEEAGWDGNVRVAMVQAPFFARGFLVLWRGRGTHDQLDREPPGAVSGKLGELSGGSR